MAMKVQGGKMTSTGQKEPLFFVRSLLAQVERLDSEMTALMGAFASGAQYVPSDKLDQYQKAARRFVAAKEEISQVKNLLVTTQR